VLFWALLEQAAPSLATSVGAAASSDWMFCTDRGLRDGMNRRLRTPSSVIKLSVPPAPEVVGGIPVEVQGSGHSRSIARGRAGAI
jgi:hypothetical protein